MTDINDELDAFRRVLDRVYPDIDPEVVRQVELAFPGEIELTCWMNEKKDQQSD